MTAAPEREARDARGTAPWWLVPFGLVVGFVGSLAGVGGGLFVIPVLQYVLRLPLKVAAATALVLVAATTSGATLSELFQPQPQVAWRVVLPLLVGVLVGAQIGFYVAERIRIRPLRILFVVFLLASASRVFLAGPLLEPVGEDLVVSWLGAASAALVGLCGGFVAPLLGIGGGLMMVPGLLFVLPQLGFAGARATSLAAGSVASLRSMLLHARAGRVRWAPGLRLGLGSLVGGWIGVQVAHVPGMRDAGRPVIGAILVFVALRFLKDLLHPPASDDEESKGAREAKGAAEVGAAAEAVGAPDQA